MSDISISKVKLIKGGEKVMVFFKETSEDGMNATTSKTCSNRAHPDLIKAINGLCCHMAILTDYLTEKRAADKDELKKFVVSSYSIGGKEEEPGIVITGYRKTRSGKTVTLNTPFLKLDSTEETYYLIKDLNNRIAKIEEEVDNYLFEGKKADDVQGEMFPEEKKGKKEKVDKIIIDHPEEQYAGSNDAIAPQTPVVNMKDKAKKSKPGKKVPQSADVPSGEVVNE